MQSPGLSYPVYEEREEKKLLRNEIYDVPLKFPMCFDLYLSFFPRTLISSVLKGEFKTVKAF